MDFEWDPSKAKINAEKHGVSFHQASTLFYDPNSLTFFDPDHSEEEDRFLTIGQSVDGTLLIASHTDRAERIRIISARKAKRSERRIYENG